MLSQMNYEPLVIRWSVLKHCTPVDNLNKDGEHVLLIKVIKVIV